MHRRVIFFCVMQNRVSLNTSSPALNEKGETLGLSGNTFSLSDYVATECLSSDVGASTGERGMLSDRFPLEYF